MIRPAHIVPLDVDDLILALHDPRLRGPAALVARAPTAAFIRAITGHAPPLQHAAAVLASARALAGLALLFGDPVVIDAVATIARTALHDGSVTVEDLFGRDHQERSPSA